MKKNLVLEDSESLRKKLINFLDATVITTGKPVTTIEMELGVRHMYMRLKKGFIPNTINLMKLSKGLGYDNLISFLIELEKYN